MEFENVLSEYLKPIYNFCFRLVGNEDDAKDLTQDVFIKIWKNLKKYDSKKSLKTWVFTIARNTCYDWLRKKKNITFSQIDNLSNLDEENINFIDSISDDQLLPDEIFIEKENSQKVDQALKILSPDQLEIIILKYTEELTFEEISEVLGKSINTIKSLNRRALSKMRSYLEN